jgi:hypothetical protein
VKSRFGYEFGVERFYTCSPQDSYWIVKLPLTSNEPDGSIGNWLINRFGEVDSGRWYPGVFSTYEYQEYWFDQEENAVETFLTWFNS